MGEPAKEQPPKRIVFKDAEGKFAWFSIDQIELDWCDECERQSGEESRLALLPGNKWVLFVDAGKSPYHEPGTPTKGRFICESEALDWLLERGHEPPACLTAALNERCIVKPNDERNECLLHVLDEDDGGRHVVIDVSGAPSWGPHKDDSGDYDSIDQIPTWFYSDTLYRLSSGRFVRIRDRSHREADFPFEPEVKRLTDAKAAEWLLFGGFEPPADIAHLADKHRFSHEIPQRPASATDDHADKPAIHWNGDTCELFVNGELARKLRGRAIARNVAKVLDCFTEDGWPQRIDSPFENSEGGKQTCRETLRSLNEGICFIRFAADGSGEGILWKLDSPPVTSRASPEIPF